LASWTKKRAQPRHYYYKYKLENIEYYREYAKLDRAKNQLTWTASAEDDLLNNVSSGVIFTADKFNAHVGARTSCAAYILT
jgi:hypothetical protein